MLGSIDQSKPDIRRSARRDRDHAIEAVQDLEDAVARLNARIEVLDCEMQQPMTAMEAACQPFSQPHPGGTES